MRNKIEKKIGSQYIRSHTKFLRKGDEFRMHFSDNTHVDLVAESNPYYDTKASEWVVDIENPEYEDMEA